MMSPRLIYAIDLKTMEQAYMVSLVPTFDPPAPQEDMEVLHDLEPDLIEILPG